MSPITTPRADDEPNDRFGYSCYVIAIPASESLIEAQQAIWREFPPRSPFLAPGEDPP